jgi:hypothetical protein
MLADRRAGRPQADDVPHQSDTSGLNRGIRVGKFACQGLGELWTYRIASVAERALGAAEPAANLESLLPRREVFP